MKNRQLTLGFFAGALYFIWKMIVLSQGKQHEWLVSFPAAPLLGLVGVAIFLSITQLTPKGNPFPEDFKAGARTALVAGLTAGFFVFIYYNWFDPEFLPIRVQEQVDAARAFGETPENLKKGEENMRNFFSPFWFSTFTISGVAFFGMAFSLILSALKRAFNVL